jgi:regulator of sigma E protease
MSVIYFLLLLGALVVIHELGHFVAAKLLDFKVLRFSIGFGRRLLRIRGRETEYQLGVIPLGGYVRILGEDTADPIDPSERHRSFGARPLWQRLVVVFAGPAANLVFPIAIYFLFFAGQRELPAAVVGDVIVDSPAARAGIEPGDRILAVGAETVRYWEDLETLIGGRGGRELRLRMSRRGRELEKYVVPVERVVRSRDGGSARQGWLGIAHAPFRPRVGVIDPSSPAGIEGMRTADLVISVDGKEVDNWTTLRRLLGEGTGRKMVAFLRGTEVPGMPSVRVLEARTADVVPEARTDEAGRSVIHIGLAPAEMFVAHVAAGSPAARAGLRPSDLVTTLDGEPVAHWMLLDQALQADPGHVFTLGWQRTVAAGDAATSALAGGGAKAMTGQLVQERRRTTDEYGHRGQTLWFGAANDVDQGAGELVAIEGRFGYSLAKAVERTADTVGAIAAGFFSILRGEAPHESMGGPLMMYRVASVSGAKGWDAFLLMMALISVNLGLINLLPVPMLDGGQLVVFAIEAVRRRPLTRRGRERIMLCGLAVVVAITVLALRNDVARYLAQ